MKGKGEQCEKGDTGKKGDSGADGNSRAEKIAAFFALSAVVIAVGIAVAAFMATRELASRMTDLGYATYVYVDSKCGKGPSIRGIPAMQWFVKSKQRCSKHGSSRSLERSLGEKRIWI